jgi:hypothetical protein
MSWLLALDNCWLQICKLVKNNKTMLWRDKNPCAAHYWIHSNLYWYIGSLAFAFADLVAAWFLWRSTWLMSCLMVSIETMGVLCSTRKLRQKKVLAGGTVFRLLPTDSHKLNIFNSGTPPPSSGLHFIRSKFCYHLYCCKVPTFTWTLLSPRRSQVQSPSKAQPKT